MPVTYLTIKIPGQDDLALELEPGASIAIEAGEPVEEETEEEEEEEEEEVEADTEDEPAADDEPEEDPEADEEEEDDDEPRALPGAGWARVEGFDALPSLTREALLHLGPMCRSGITIPKTRALPSGFERISETSHVFLLSDTSVGRDGFVLAGPWDLDEYRANPVVLYQHNATWETPAAGPDDLLPVARALQVVEPEEGLLISEVEFDLESPRGARLDRLYRQGFLSAVSARWYPQSVAPAHKLDKSDPYYNFDAEVIVMYGNRLIEQSAVIVPGLASATLLAGPVDSGRALDGVRAHIDDPEFRSDLEAVILAAPVPRVEPSAAEPTDPEPIPVTGWWDTLSNTKE